MDAEVLELQCTRISWRSPANHANTTKRKRFRQPPPLEVVGQFELSPCHPEEWSPSQREGLPTKDLCIVG